MKLTKAIERKPHHEDATPSYLLAPVSKTLHFDPTLRTAGEVAAQAMVDRALATARRTAA